MIKKPLSKLKLFIYFFVRAILILTCIFAFHEKAYFVGFQCILALVLFMLPTFIDRGLNVALPNALEIIVILFIFSGIFLGEIQGYYQQYPLWDKMLHTSSGFLTAAIGFSLIDILNRSERVTFRLSPVFVGIFAFCFSMTVGVVWEFYEFGMDMLLHFDMQKDTFIASISSVLFNGGTTVPIDSVVINGEIWAQYIDIGLIDTMNDLIVNAIGAVVFSIFGLIYIKNRGKKMWVENLMPRAKTQAEIALEKHEFKQRKEERQKNKKEEKK